MEIRFTPTVPYHPLQSPPRQSDDPSVLAFSLAKAGSTLLYNILHELAPAAGLTYFSIEDALFHQNVSPNLRVGNIGNVFSPTGFCYGGFRQFPAFPVPILHQCRAIFLVRDPRDMAVSLYFSLLKSHVLPGATGEDGGARAEMDQVRSAMSSVEINAWIEREAGIQYTRMFEGYIAQGFLWRPNIAIYRYEDVIFEKLAWIRDICNWYQWDVPANVQERVARQFDIVPDEERSDQHIRQVTPGNYRQHLSNSAIQAIEGQLRHYMKLFDYGP